MDGTNIQNIHIYSRYKYSKTIEYSQMNKAEISLNPNMERTSYKFEALVDVECDGKHMFSLIKVDLNCIL